MVETNATTQGDDSRAPGMGRPTIRSKADDRRLPPRENGQIAGHSRLPDDTLPPRLVLWGRCGYIPSSRIDSGAPTAHDGSDPSENSPS